MKKKFVALARVSSREQEREGFSLDVQEQALLAYVARVGGSIDKLYRIAETASKQQERATFKELLSYVKKNATSISGLLFYKVDRAARNLFDYVELERLENDCGVPVIYVSQPTEKSPAGRMQLRMLASMASFYTEQQSLDVREGMVRRAESGLFVGKAPYGYLNVRKDGRGLIEVHPDESKVVKKIFDLYANYGHTLDSLVDKLADDGIEYRPSIPKFARSKIHTILKDRAYIGEVFHKSQWHDGQHRPLIDRVTWDKVQVLLGEKVYRSHEMTYAGELIKCAHCGRFITGEVKTKSSKTGLREYAYYRCARYASAGHPRIRLTETDLDAQVLAYFDRLKVKDTGMADWIGKVLRTKSRASVEASRERTVALEQQIAKLRGQMDQLLNLRLVGEIESDTYAKKNTEFKDRLATLTAQRDACERGHEENADLAVKAFELSQTLTEKWVKADYAEKRVLLEIVCLNYLLDDASLVMTTRSPFDLLEKQEVFIDGRGDRI